MTCSVDFRHRALKIKENFNLTYTENARRFGVGSASQKQITDISD
jgi:hypothetical protein